MPSTACDGGLAESAGRSAACRTPTQLQAALPYSIYSDQKLPEVHERFVVPAVRIASDSQGGLPRSAVLHVVCAASSINSHEPRPCILCPSYGTTIGNAMCMAYYQKPLCTDKKNEYCFFKLFRVCDKYLERFSCNQSETTEKGSVLANVRQWSLSTMYIINSAITSKVYQLKFPIWRSWHLCSGSSCAISRHTLSCSCPVVSSS